MEHVMQNLSAAVVVFVVLLSAVSAVSAADGEIIDQLTPSLATLTKTETVTLTIPPLTITETFTTSAKEIHFRTVTQTEQACSDISPTTITKTIDEYSSTRLEECLRDMSSILGEKPTNIAGVTTTLPGSMLLETTVTEAPATVTNYFTETVTFSEFETSTTVKSDSTDEFVESLTTLMKRIADIYPFVEAADKVVLDLLTSVADVKRVELQLKELPRNQRELAVSELLELTESIRGMVKEDDSYKRVVPINFMGSVKRLVRYLQRLIRF